MKGGGRVIGRAICTVRYVPPDTRGGAWGGEGAAMPNTARGPEDSVVCAGHVITTCSPSILSRVRTALSPVIAPTMKGAGSGHSTLD